MHTMHQSDFLGSPISFLVFPKCFWNFWMINQSSQSCGNFLKKDRPTWKQTPWRHLTFRRSPAFSSLHPCLTKASQQNRPPRCPNGRPSSRSAPLKTLLPDQDPLSWSEFTTQLAGGTTLEAHLTVWPMDAPADLSMASIRSWWKGRSMEMIGQWPALSTTQP